MIRPKAKCAVLSLFSVSQYFRPPTHACEMISPKLSFERNISTHHRESLLYPHSSLSSIFLFDLYLFICLISQRGIARIFYLAKDAKYTRHGFHTVRPWYRRGHRPTTALRHVSLERCQRCLRRLLWVHGLQGRARVAVEQVGGGGTEGGEVETVSQRICLAVQRGIPPHNPAGRRVVPVGEGGGGGKWSVCLCGQRKGLQMNAEGCELYRGVLTGTRVSTF